MDSGQVAVVDPALATPLVATAMAQAAATASSHATAPYVLTVFVENDSLPVISIEAAAPSRPSRCGSRMRRPASSRPRRPPK